jgi:RimJ/RimL family protein N-acetyltransferase
MEMPVLECERVRLRAFRSDDVHAAFALFGDPDVARYWSGPAWTTLAQAEEWLAPQLKPLDEKPSMLPWAVADRATDVMLGTGTIFAINREHQRAEIGYSLQRAHWGKGLATEVARRMLAYGFDDMKLRRFEADADPRNTSSLKLLEKLGFQREGYARERWNVITEIADAVLLGLLAREYQR